MNLQNILIVKQIQGEHKMDALELTLKTNSEIIRNAKKEIKGKRAIFLGGIIIFIIVSMLTEIPKIGKIVSVIISGPLLFGISAFSLAIYRKEKVNSLFVLNGFKVMLSTMLLSALMGLYTFLKLLRLVIPGIFAFLDYSQSYYILKDNPSLEERTIIEESKRLMSGNRKRYCLLQLKLFLSISIYFLPALICLALVKLFEIQQSQEMMLFIYAVTWLFIIINFIPEYLVSLAAFYDEVKNEKLMFRKDEEVGVE